MRATNARPPTMAEPSRGDNANMRHPGTKINSTSSSSEAAGTPTWCMFNTKSGTELPTFESYIKTLPDREDGKKNNDSRNTVANIHDDIYSCASRRSCEATVRAGLLCLWSSWTALLSTWKDHEVLVCAKEVQVRPIRGVYSRVLRADREVVLSAGSLKFPCHSREIWRQQS
jgi:hypothetical protein